MMVALAPVSSSAVMVMGGGTVSRAARSAASRRALMPISIDSTGPIPRRLGTVTVSEGTSLGDGEETAAKRDRCFHSLDLLHQHWDIAQPVVANIDGVIFVIVDAQDLVAMDQDISPFIRGQKTVLVLVKRFQLLLQDVC